MWIDEILNDNDNNLPNGEDQTNERTNEQKFENLKKNLWKKKKYQTKPNIINYQIILLNSIFFCQ